MSLRELIDPECGGANPLMRLGQQIVHGSAHKDEGISGRPMPFAESSSRSHPSQFPQAGQDQLVNEFLGQMSAPPPQSFRMDALLQEMREIDAQSHPVELIRAPTISAEVQNHGISWTNEFHHDEVGAVGGNLKSAPPPLAMQQVHPNTAAIAGAAPQNEQVKLHTMCCGCSDLISSRNITIFIISNNFFLSPSLFRSFNHFILTNLFILFPFGAN